MPTLGENPSATPILDSLLVGFHVAPAIQLAMRMDETEKIKEDLGLKAEQKILTKEDIEEGLNRIPARAGTLKEGQQKSILAYLALNYGAVFVQVTGHDPF